MKKNTLYYLILPVLMVMLTACTATKSEDVDKAEQKVRDAKIALNLANEKYAKEVESYRAEMALDLRNNKLLIAELRNEKSDANEETIKVRKAEIEALRKQNDALESRMNNYKSDNQENWKAFKREFNEDMNELGKAFKNLSTNNSN